MTLQASLQSLCSLQKIIEGYNYRNGGYAYVLDPETNQCSPTTSTRILSAMI